MSEQRKYKCVLCERVFYADPKEIRRSEMTLCDQCRADENSANQPYSAATDLIAHAVRTGARIVKSAAQNLSDRTADFDRNEDDFDPNFSARSRNGMSDRFGYSSDDPGCSPPKRSGIETIGRVFTELGQAINRGMTDSRSAFSSASGRTASLSDDWICIGNLYEAYESGILRRYNDVVGLYMHTVDGEVKYIGRAVEYANGGFRKRLSDYCRESDSARKHTSGQIIHANMHRITTYLLIVGSDSAAAERTKLLEKEYIQKYNPPWNDQYARRD